MIPLPRWFYKRSTKDVARELLGKKIVREIDAKQKVIKIVETEAYLGPHDLAAHSRFGQTARNLHLFGPSGHAYVFLIYGVYHCLNVVTEGGIGAAVLIRAGEPVENITWKTAGPGLLCQALGVDRSFNGLDLTKIGPLYLAESDDLVSKKSIVTTSRIGVAYAKNWATRPLRFYIKGNPFVSKP